MLGFSLHELGPQPSYESVSRYLATTSHPNDPIFVWGSVPEIYWASGKLPATKFLTTSFLTGVYPGRPQDQRTQGRHHEAGVGRLLRRLREAPPALLHRHVDLRRSRRRRVPDLELPRLVKIVAEQYRYEITIDGYDIYERR